MGQKETSINPKAEEEEKKITREYQGTPIIATMVSK
jgi:hypothetical protein